MLARYLNDPAIDDAATGSNVMWTSRLLLIAIMTPLVWFSVGPQAALFWFGFICFSELYARLASDALARTPNFPVRLVFLGAALVTILAWLSLSLIFWLSNDPALQMAAVCLWAGILIYVQGFMHGSIITLAVAGLPTTMVMIGAPLLHNPFQGAGQVILIGMLIVVIGFAVRATQVYYRVRAHLRDVTQSLEEQKRAAEQASEAKSAFLATMSHEVRTPLNGILGMARILEGRVEDPDQRNQIRTIIDSGSLLTAVLNDVLDLSKIEAGRLEISPVDADLFATLNHAAALFEGTARENGVRLDVEISETIPARLHFDPVRISQCVSNLLSNAVKFTSQGAVTLRARCEAAADSEDGALRIIVSVSDTGIGISAEAIETLFSPFTQADGSISRRFQGSGLGLSIVRRLAQLMGGGVTVESLPGEGSTFELSFLAEPAMSNEADEAEPLTQIKPLIRGKRVLVVDDNAVNRQIAAIFLNDFDCIIAEAEDGEAALDCLSTQAFDLILMDLHMPVMDGFAAIARIRESGAPWADIPVIALTADAMGGDCEKCIEAGMDSYAAKPLDPRQLLTAMAAALGKQRIIAEAPKQRAS